MENLRSVNRWKPRQRSNPIRAAWHWAITSNSENQQTAIYHSINSMALSHTRRRGTASAESHYTVDDYVADNKVRSAPISVEARLTKEDRRFLHRPQHHEVAYVDLIRQYMQTRRKNEAYIFGSSIVSVSPLTSSLATWRKGRRFPTLCGL